MENGAGPVYETFMQNFLWTGGMIISFNPLEMQFSITRYAPRIPPMQSLRLYVFNIELYLFSGPALHRAIRRRGVNAR